CCRPDVLTEEIQRKSGIGKSSAVVPRSPHGALGEVPALAGICHRILAPTIHAEPKAADRRPSEGGSVVWVARNRLLENTERLGDLPRCQDQFVAPQIKVVGGEVTGWAVGGSRSLSGLERR